MLVIRVKFAFQALAAVGRRIRQSFRDHVDACLDGRELALAGIPTEHVVVHIGLPPLLSTSARLGSSRQSNWCRSAAATRSPAYFSIGHWRFWKNALILRNRESLVYGTSAGEFTAGANAIEHSTNPLVIHRFKIGHLCCFLGECQIHYWDPEGG